MFTYRVTNWWITTLGLVIVSNPLLAQSTFMWELQSSPAKASLRGLFAVDDTTAWASGSSGTVLRSIDGRSWSDVSVAEAEKLDFRDIHAFDADTALVLSAGSPGRVYRTEDGGRSWRRVYSDERPEIFFDAMAFWDRRYGIAFGDPIDSRLTIIATRDGGRTWQAIPGPRVPEKVAGFAASGTSLCVLGNADAWIGTGGPQRTDSAKPPSALVFHSSDRGVTWTQHTAPLATGASSGIFSLAFSDARIGVAVGGDYLKPDRAAGNVAVTRDGGVTWQVPRAKPRGYRSCVTLLRRPNGRVLWVAVGPSGTDVSFDSGDTWQPVDRHPFHSVAASPTGRVLWASGADGRIARAVRLGE